MYLKTRADMAYGVLQDDSQNLYHVFQPPEKNPDTSDADENEKQTNFAVKTFCKIAGVLNKTFNLKHLLKKSRAS